MISASSFLSSTQPICRGPAFVVDARDGRRVGEKPVELKEVADVRIAGIRAADAIGIGEHRHHQLRGSRPRSHVRPIVLPYDFDIFLPSRPGTFGVAVNSGCGSTGHRRRNC